MFLTPDSLVTSQNSSSTSADLLSCSVIPAECTLFLSCLYSTISLLGLPLNVLVLWAMWPQVRSPMGVPIYVANLLCAALLQAVTLPFGVVYLLRGWKLGSMSCSMLCLIPSLIQGVAAMFAVWIFGVRYVAVAHPLKYRKLCSGWVCSLVSLSLWLLPVAFSIAVRGIVIDNTDVCFPNHNVAPEWALFDLIFCFLFGVLPWLLLGILWFLISNALKNSPSVPIKQRRRISSLLLLVVVGFGVLFGPINGIRGYQSILVLLGQHLCHIEQSLLLPYHLVFALNCFSVVLAPLFYAFSSSGVKKRLMGLIRKDQETHKLRTP
ncbi:G-protein coupled receptor 4-like [Ascaphus truei]|uniref:G-protein coupled receptor 4-like n=1 Tax=Ascaphus truei TaxID=8439 RepID=UPI003F596494